MRNVGGTVGPGDSTTESIHDAFDEFDAGNCTGTGIAPVDSAGGWQADTGGNTDGGTGGNTGGNTGAGRGVRCPHTGPEPCSLLAGVGGNQGAHTDTSCIGACGQFAVLQDGVGGDGDV